MKIQLLTLTLLITSVPCLAITKSTALGSIVNSALQFEIRETGIGTDLALAGNGYFVLQDQAGTRFLTRDGRIELNSANILVQRETQWPIMALDSSGNISEINLSEFLTRPSTRHSSGVTHLTSVAISDAGKIEALLSDGTSETIAQLALGTVQNPRKLGARSRTGFVLFATPQSGSIEYGRPLSGVFGKLIRRSRELLTTDYWDTCFD